MNWLIKALGGYTRHEFDLINTTLDGWRNRAISAETSVSLFKEIMTRDKEAVDQARRDAQIMMQNPTPPNMKPVGNTISSWPRIRREMERQHQVKSDAQVSREEIERTIREG